MIVLHRILAQYPFFPINKAQTFLKKHRCSLIISYFNLSNYHIINVNHEILTI